LVLGLPEMVGPVTTVIWKAGSDALATPSLTVITIPEYVPTLATAGVPVSWPVDALNVAHAGLPTMEKLNRLPEVSEAVGWKE
jgi:hypothetical protein